MHRGLTLVVLNVDHILLNCLPVIQEAFDDVWEISLTSHMQWSVTYVITVTQGRVNKRVLKISHGMRKQRFDAVNVTRLARCMQRNSPADIRDHDGTLWIPFFQRNRLDCCGVHCDTLNSSMLNQSETVRTLASSSGPKASESRRW